MKLVKIKLESTDRLMNTEEVAEYLGVSVSWVNKRAADGEIPLRKVGRLNRFIEREIVNWVDQQNNRKVV